MLKCFKNNLENFKNIIRLTTHQFHLNIHFDAKRKYNRKTQRPINAHMSVHNWEKRHQNAIHV